LQNLIGKPWERYKPYRISNNGMKSTIISGDSIFVDTYAYGNLAPKVLYSLYRSSIKRGDVVVFTTPKNPGRNSVSRVIAIGGDTIELIGEKIFINGKLEKEKYVFLDDTIYTVAMDNKIEIPAGRLFVMGDNRRNSKDSRYWGYVNEVDVKGKVTIVVSRLD